MEDEVFNVTYEVRLDDETDSELNGSRPQSSISIRQTDCEVNLKPKIRAKSARELVRNQEHLVDLLQSMKSDISKMDREASRIKEDIIRSTQLFHVMVKRKKAHHLQNISGGFNISYSMPRDTYQRYKSTGRELNIPYLNQLSTYRPNFLSDSSRRSSLSSASSRNYNGYQGPRHSSSLPNTVRSSPTSGNSSTSDDSYSGNSATESEIDSAISGQISLADSLHSVSQNSDTEDDAGSSTESASTLGPTETELNRRRSSYFYTARRFSPPPVLSDEVDL